MKEFTAGNKKKVDIKRINLWISRGGACQSKALPSSPPRFRETGNIFFSKRPTTPGLYRQPVILSSPSILRRFLFSNKSLEIVRPYHALEP